MQMHLCLHVCLCMYLWCVFEAEKRGEGSGVGWLIHLSSL